VSADEAYELVLTPPARRALTDRLPEPVAAAVIDFLTTALITDPRRLGKPLRVELAGLWAARRGTYRVLYRLRDDPRMRGALRRSAAARLDQAGRGTVVWRTNDIDQAQMRAIARHFA
jgi:mRNA-degrading endonuclease RelE of RelBE toxin-antitoxin system